LDASSSAKNHGVLKKALWMGLSIGLVAGARAAARQAADRIWRVATGEAPPGQKQK